VQAWIDIENPPQVQYLLPFRDAFAEAEVDVLLTARDYGITFELLEAAGCDFRPVGSSYGKGKLQKLVGLAHRTRQLSRSLRGLQRPDLLLHAGRAAPLVARRLGATSFSIWDYEWADITFDRIAGSYVVFPDVIDPDVFRTRGIRPDRLMPFRGLKEDLSFADLDVEAISAHRFDELDDRLVRVLFRPAAEESHYYRSESGRTSIRLLEHLAGREEVGVVFAPRYPWQEHELARLDWANRPVVLREAVPFVSLLKAVDLVVSSGGTMVREAAYLGIPAYSTFRGKPGGVDLHLEETGRLRFVESPADFARVDLTKRAQLSPPSRGREVLADLTRAIVHATSARAGVS
jgi:predicted glycosyltransferase